VKVQLILCPPPLSFSSSEAPALICIFGQFLSKVLLTFKWKEVKTAGFVPNVIKSGLFVFTLLEKSEKIEIRAFVLFPDLLASMSQAGGK